MVSGPDGTVPKPTTTAAVATTAVRGHAVDGAFCDLTHLEVLRRLGSGPRGLVEPEAERRLAAYGENALHGARRTGWLRAAAQGLRDPFTAVLCALGPVLLLIGSWGTACVSTALVAVSCVLRAHGERRAGRSLAALRGLIGATATVRRRSSTDAAPRDREIPAEQLVPGDVVQLGPGDSVPADVRLLRATGLQVEQAVLSGESAPVPKYPCEEPEDAAAGPFSRPYLCFQGSSVTSGTGSALVVATGGHTWFAGFTGAETGDSGRGRTHRSAFDRSVNRTVRTLVRFMLLMPPLVLLANAALRGRGLETLPFAVAVAAGLIPEMLPVVVTTAVARGAAALARDGEAVVKRLPALRDLGSAEVLCTDKTGILSQGRPTVECSLDPAGMWDDEVARWAAVNALWTVQLAEPPVPDPLDEALLKAEGTDVMEGLEYGEGIAAVPFDPVRRRSCAVVAEPGQGRTHTLVVKGAVEQVLDCCSTVRQRDGNAVEITEAVRAELLDRARELTEEDGLRLLGVCLAERPARLSEVYGTADERGLLFIGFVGLSDALAPDAVETLTTLTSPAGTPGTQGLDIAVKVVTGDHPGTALRVCREAGLEPGPRGAVTGEEIDAWDDGELAGIAARERVFARCTPEQKARVVGALAAGGRTTAFLGDGVNDLPALRASDVALAPAGAAPAARAAADIVLLPKGLRMLPGVVLTGRRSVANIVSYLRVALSCNLGNVFAMLVAGVLLPFLPMLPTQVLLQNLCFDAAQLAFAFNQPRRADLGRPVTLGPRGLLRFLGGFGALNALADLATFGALALTTHVSVLHGPGDAGGFQAGWFTENLLTQAMVMVTLHTGSSALRAGAPRVTHLAAAALGAVGLLLPLSPLGPLLGMARLPLPYYLLLSLVLTLYCLVLNRAWRRYTRTTAVPSTEDLPREAAARRVRQP